MRTTLVAFLMGLVIFFTLGASCSNSQQSQSQPIATNIVEIEKQTFSPSTITISRGSVITWENKDQDSHQIVSDGSLVDLASGIIEKDGRFSFTFDRTGSFTYHCGIHPEMKGEVIVK